MTQLTCRYAGSGEGIEWGGIWDVKSFTLISLFINKTHNAQLT